MPNDISKSRQEITIRSATHDDASAIQRIYAPYVETTAISFELQAPDTDEMRRRITKTLRHYPYLVALLGEAIVGYAYAGPIGERGAYRYSVEMSIYVAHDHKRQGIGRTLYEALEKELTARGFLNAYAIIAAPPQPDAHLTFDSIRFHEHQGYQKVAHLHQCGRKFDSWYDVVWMEKFLSTHTDSLAPALTFTD